jgi:hypothetical protein
MFPRALGVTVRVRADPACVPQYLPGQVSRHRVADHLPDMNHTGTVRAHCIITVPRSESTIMKLGPQIFVAAGSDKGRVDP